MSHVLIIKTSSMGDVIHNLPIVHDMLQAAPETRIDWVIEEAYADIARMHPGVARVIPVAQRRWRGMRGRALALEKAAFESALQEEAYDLVLDTQGLLKSALLARAARLAPGGRKVGFSRRLAREGLARVFYDEGYDVDPRMHAVERLRALAGQALGYDPLGPPVFDLVVPNIEMLWLPQQPYVVLLHATSRVEKAWPLVRWRELCVGLADAGLRSILPYGSVAEEEVAQAIASGIDGAQLAPPLALKEVARVLAGAHAVVGVDTGLTHLAAALDRPTVALFGATPRWRYAPYWTPRTVSLGERGVQPGVSEVLLALEKVTAP